MQTFDDFYYATGLGQPYVRNEGWLAFFDSVAEHISLDPGPHTVLDAGCAIGLLVETLRGRGVEAFGIDISEFAIGQVYEPIRPYCKQGSIAEELPRDYDLIVCIEVLEHMPPAEAEKAVANFCRHTDDIIFSSTPFDYKEVTHINVRPPEYWAEQFARYGFYRDVDYDARYLTVWAGRFRRSRLPIPRIVRDYERHYWLLAKENSDLRELSADLRQQLAANQQTINALRSSLVDRQDSMDKLMRTPGRGIVRGLHRLRGRLAPPGSRRDRVLASWLLRRGHSD